MNDLRDVLGHKPTCEVGDDWAVVRLPSQADMITFTFEEINLRAQKFEAILTVEVPTQRPFRQHISAASGSNTNAYRLSLEHYFGKADYEWGRLMLTACQMAQAAYLDATQLFDPDDVQLGEAWAWHVERMLIKDRLNIVFGQGESAKSYLVEDMVLAMSCGQAWQGRATYQSNWVWLDYENPKPDAFAFRRNRLVLGGADTPEKSVHWMSGRGIPIVDLRQTLKRELSRVNAEGVVVDSLAFACGGDASKQETATAVCNVLNSLGVTVVGIAHVDKADNDLYPFGSIFWHNGAHGLIWNVKRVSEEGADSIGVGFYNRKASDGGRQRSFAVRMQFQGETGPVNIEPAELASTPGLETTAPIKARVWTLLNNRQLSAMQIAEQLSAKEDTVRKALDALHKDNVVVRIGEGGVVQWARKSVYGDEDVRN